MADSLSYDSFQNTLSRGRPSTPSQNLRPFPIESPPARKALPETPRRGRSSLGTSPGVLSPQNSPLTYSDGTPVKLYTPRAHAEARRRQRVSSPTGRIQGRRLFSNVAESPTRRLVAAARETAGRSLSLGGMLPDSATKLEDLGSPLRPGRSRSRVASSSFTTTPALAPEPLPGPVIIPSGRRERHPARPSIRLLSVINKCWDMEMEKEVQWAIRDGLMGGRLEERNRERIWYQLSSCVVSVWPTLHDWIMNYTPDDTDCPWFCRAEILQDHYFDWVIDPNLAQKQSSQERVGFSMSSEAFESACALVQQLAANHENRLEQLVKADVNPFFIIYAFADSKLPLPKGFSRQLFWKHLDAILSFQHWKGLDYTCDFASGSIGPRRAILTRLHFPPEEDPEDIVAKLAALAECGNIPELLGRSIRAGTYWYQVSDLKDEELVAPFALIDVLSRWLPEWSNSVLRIFTSDVCLMWGIRGGDSTPDLWKVVRALCEQYNVVLRAKFLEPFEDPFVHHNRSRDRRSSPAP
ncbi:hypothetical protein BGW80DRAFT_1252893 [Lactifluus volemus]|nr:hypothetical protein BGW80DRAFT_1252893 [Lactifluus volemus]